MSGTLETLAQVYREIGYPKLKNLKITANIVCVYAVLCTGVITLFAAMIIPDAERVQHFDNLIGGLAMSLSGPYILRLGFHIFVVIVGGLILSGAVNTSLIGANGILNRVAEDGVLLPWFRKPHSKYGTTSRIINLITLMQIATIIGSRGDMTILAEAYAFGVVWSFFMKALGVTALRFKRHDQEYKFPFNFRLGGKEIPVGLGITTAILGTVAIINLFTKQLATKYGIAFTVGLFVLFVVSRARRPRPKSPKERTGAIQSRSSGATRLRLPVFRLRPGCASWWPCATAAAWIILLEACARKNQSSAARYCCHDGPYNCVRRGRRSARKAKSSATTKKSSSATSCNWPKKKASRWSFW